MRIQVRWFPEGASNKKVWCATSNILSFTRVVKQRDLHRDAANSLATFRPAGPLTFRPRTAVWENQTNSPVLAVSAYFDTHFTSVTDNMKQAGMVINDFSMLEMMQVLHDEIRNPGLESEELVSSIGKILRIKLARLMNPQARNPNPLIENPRSSVDAALIHGLINSSRGRFPTTAELAEKLNLGRRELLRLFKATTGMPPSRYIEEAKLDRAKTLLAASKITMKQIAYESGYSTASHFATKFRQFTGFTPSAFRSKARRVGLHQERENHSGNGMRQ
jgi:AraC family transcriptional regulator